MSITIRDIKPDDNSALSQLIKSVFREFRIDQPGTVYTDPTTDHLYELFQSTPNSAYFVAEENNVIIGGCGVFPTPDLPAGYAELVKFYVAPEARGRGIGFELMEKSFEAARQLGYSHLYLESFPELGKAVSMYQRAGFRFIDGAMGNSGHFACEIFMVKEL